MKNLTFKISGLTCRACKKITEKRISGIAGVRSVEVDLSTANTVIVSERDISSEEIKTALQGTAYEIL